MIEVLKGVDNWFLVFLVIVLGGYFLWSVQKMFAGLQETILELKNLIKELFEDRNDHGERIKAIEARCEERHRQH